MFLIFLGWFPREYVFFRGEASEIAVFVRASCFCIIFEQLTARIRMMSNKNHMSRYNMCVHAYRAVGNLKPSNSWVSSQNRFENINVYLAKYVFGIALSFTVRLEEIQNNNLPAY